MLKLESFELGGQQVKSPRKLSMGAEDKMLFPLKMASEFRNYFLGVSLTRGT